MCIFIYLCIYWYDKMEIKSEEMCKYIIVEFYFFNCGFLKYDFDLFVLELFVVVVMDVGVIIERM